MVDIAPQIFRLELEEPFTIGEDTTSCYNVDLLRGTHYFPLVLNFEGMISMDLVIETVIYIHSAVDDGSRAPHPDSELR